MEITHAHDEMAHLKVTLREERLLEDLFIIARKPDNIKGADTPWNPAVHAQFEHIVQELFPTLPPYRCRTNGYTMSAKPYGSDKKTNVSIAVRAGVRYQPEQVALVIAKDPWRAAIQTHSYDLGCIDDLVEKIGSSEQPRIEPYRTSTTQHSTAWKYHTQVVRFDLVQETYARARNALERIQHITPANLPDMRILRVDSTKHPNLFVRRGSAQLYNDLLEKLRAYAVEQ